jgi:putative ABC transport system permease protein
MWLISAKDLQFRLRRFVIAVAVTAIVFGMALAFDSIKRALQAEVPRIVGLFHADGWVVARGASGPFTTAQVIPSSTAAELRDEPGVGRADPVVVSRSVVDAGERVDVNVVGYRLGGLGTPPTDEGRAPRSRGEVVVTEPIDAVIGTRIRLGGKVLRVVGRNADARYNFGVPTVFISLADAQTLAFDARPLAMAVAVTGSPRLPPGLALLSNDQVEDDMRRVIKGGIGTIDFTSALLWLVAAGIIGSISYLTALERTRDFAVFKATGMPGRTIAGGLAAQAVFLAIVSAFVAIGLAHLIVLGIPFPADIGGASILQLVVISVVVGILASFASLRRLRTTDPAVAFGGA